MNFVPSVCLPFTADAGCLLSWRESEPVCSEHVCVSGSYVFGVSVGLQECVCVHACMCVKVCMSILVYLRFLMDVCGQVCMRPSPWVHFWVFYGKACVCDELCICR